MKLGIIGDGRLGMAIADYAVAAPGVELVWQSGIDSAPQAGAEVALDASIGSAVEEHLEWALATGTDLVIAATGWEIADLAGRVGNRIGVLAAPNFSLTVALMARLSTVMGRFAALDPNMDPYVTDHHHRLKQDAPSGTAIGLAKAVMAGCERKTGWTLGTPELNQLSISVLRAGTEFGKHTVGLDGPAEVLELTHQARSRAVFAQGAVLAATWLKGRKGVFSFDQCTRETLDPLFQFGDAQ